MPMNRAEKLRTLQDALQGQAGPLQQLHRQRQKDALPYLEVYGIFDIRTCPLALYSLSVIDGEIDEGRIVYEPLSAYLCRFSETDPKQQQYLQSAIALMDAEDSQYDAVPVSYIEIKKCDYSSRILPDCTVAHLRGFYARCADSLSECPSIPLIVENRFRLLDSYADELSRLKQ